MKSFRIVDTKFRILKGGKIGLAASIALIGGMLTLGSTSANAEDYFTGINSTGGSFTLDNTKGTVVLPLSDNILTAQTRLNDLSSNTAHRSSTVIEDVIFNPTSFVTSTYILAGSAITDDSDDTFYTVASTYPINLPSLTLTFNNGANANNISKDDMTVYSTGNGNSFNGNSAVSANLTSITTDTYTANLIFNGTNVVSGSTDIDQGNITIKGLATFAGTVKAGSIDVETPSLITFNDKVDLTVALGDDILPEEKLTFKSAGNVYLNKGLDGNIDFNGQNAKVTLGDGYVSGDVYTAVKGSGSLSFTSSNPSGVVGNIGGHEVDGSVVNKAIKEVSIDGTGGVRVDGFVNTNLVTFNSAGTLEVWGSLDTTKADGSIGKVVFNEVDGTLEVGGNLTANVSTVNNNEGTVIMAMDEDLTQQVITGSLGTSTNKLKELQISAGSLVVSNTDIYATTTNFDGDSSLSMASDKNLYSTVVTETDETGILNLVGGTQFVTGQVGESDALLNEVNSGANGANATFRSDVYAYTLNNTGTGITNFDANVTATDINVNAGVSNFANNVIATTTTISAGTGNFNTNGTGTTTSNIAFNNAGTANLHTGLTGNVAFNGEDATVNVWDAKAISGAITTTTNNTGTLNFRGDSDILSTVGTSSAGIKSLNINTNNEQNTTAGVTANGNIYAQNINLQNNGTLTLAASINATTANITTTANDTGALRLEGGNTVNGQVGADAAALKKIDLIAGDATFNDMVYATTVNVDSNSSLTLNGQNGTAGGLKGTLNLKETDSALHIGNGVNLTTGTEGIMFANANNSTMTFDGNSTVNGDIGGNTAGRSTFKEISVGTTTSASIVTFNGDIHTPSFILDSSSTANVANGKSIIADSIEGIDGGGTLNFLGSTTLHSDIGEDGSLAEVNFNTASNNVTQTIDKNIYADTTTIGHTSLLGDSALSLADVTGVYDYAGATAMKEWRGQTAANITKDVTFGGDLVIAGVKSAINFGTSQVTVGNDFKTNNAGMSFTVNTKDITNDQTGIANSDGSAKVTVDGALIMSGAEKIQINYVGSLKQAGTYDLITALSSSGTYAGNETNGLISDNSFAIDTKVDLVDDSLVVSADRTSGGQNSANELYIQKSQTQGDLSNNAAKVLASIAAAGSQTGDMVEVIQKMEIDSFGYGNSQANLETQVKRLAPIANASYSQSALGANTLAINTVSNRLSDLRGGSNTLSSTGQSGLSSGDEIARNGAWAKVIGSTATQKQDGMYDGYKTNSGGLAAGIDHQFKNDITAGLALGYTSTNIDQQDFRSGDSADTKSYNIVAYAGKDFENAYVEGALSYAMHNTQGSRATAVGRTAQSDIDANQYTAHTSAGYRFNIQDSATVTPFLALDYTHLTQDAYTETGAGAINLNVSELSTSRTTVGGGVKLGSKIESGSTTLTPELKLATYHISGGNDTDIAAQYVGGGEKFVTPGSDLNNMMYNVGLGLKAQISDNTTLGFAVDYDRSSDGLFEGYTGQVFGRIAF